MGLHILAEEIGQNMTYHIYFTPLQRICQQFFQQIHANRRLSQWIILLFRVFCGNFHGQDPSHRRYLHTTHQKGITDNARNSIFSHHRDRRQAVRAGESQAPLRHAGMHNRQRRKGGKPPVPQRTRRHREQHRLRSGTWRADMPGHGHGGDIRGDRSGRTHHRRSV